MRRRTRVVCLQDGLRSSSLLKVTLLLAPVLLSIPVNQAFAQGNAPPFVGPKVAPLKLNIDLSKLPHAAPAVGPAIPRPVIPGTVRPSHGPQPPDPLRQSNLGGILAGGNLSALGVTPSQFTTPSPSFGGMSGGGFPPDTNGAPGRNHYIQTINVSFAIWDKTGTLLAGPSSIQNLWNLAGAPATNQCRSNNGAGGNYFASDPYVQYDQLADRWVISFGAGATIPFGGLSDFHIMCFAVSQGPNPVTSGWFLYNFDVVKAADYPKFGVWPDGYYMITQEGYNGGNLDATVFDRGNMLNGNPATFQQKSFFAFTGFGGETVIALPSELTGPLPPAGSPNFYVRPVDGDEFSDGADRIEIWEFHTDWGNPANTAITAKQTLTPAPFNSSCDAGGDNALGQDCIDQPGTSNLLDGQTTWPRSPLQYHNFGDHETIVLSHGVNVTGGTPGIVGMRWYELRRTPPGSGSWVLYQQGTFEPTDLPNSNTTTVHRWNGSVAIDSMGNMALGYNVSNKGTDVTVPTVAPGIRYVGRLATDALGEMTTPEVTLATGSGFIPSSGDPKNPNDRWGDYSTMRLDPVDGCTFWYTSEFLSGGGQASQIGAFRFPTCNPANLSITKTASPNPVTAGTQLDYTITVKNNGPANATNVIVTDVLPASVTLLNTTVVCTSGSLSTGCNIGNLASGASTFFTIQVKVHSNASSAISNTAAVSSDQLDPDLSDNTSTVITNVVQSADLRVTKTCKPDTSPAPAGSTAICTIQVDNLGPSDASNVSLTDNIVSNTTFTITSVSPFACSGVPVSAVSSASLTCNLGTQPAGSSVTETISFTAVNGGDINDTAAVSSSTPDPNPNNNSATGKVTFASVADLSITKTSAPNPVVAGTNLTYTITASNAGPSSATNVVVTDTLPGQISVVSVSPSVGSCSGGIPGNLAQPLICTLGTLANAGSATIVVVVKVNPSTPDGAILINNAAISSATNDPNNNNNVATANAPVVARGDLVITKTSDKPNYKPNALITYTVSVTNNGPSDSQAVIVTDNLPSVFQALYLDDTGGCAKSGLTLTCNLGNMPLGTTKSFIVHMTVKGNRGTITNVASVASSTTDPNAANNTSTLSVGVK